MPHRIAITSTDGKFIHQHFGRAERFHVVDLSDFDYKHIENRDVPASCKGSEHDVSAFENVYKTALYDCEAVIVGKIGYRASEFLFNKGLRVFEAPGVIDDVLTEMIESRLLE
jgi:predicted Fe-Mo cluster-binding NifX family protein